MGFFYLKGNPEPFKSIYKGCIFVGGGGVEYIAAGPRDERTSVRRRKSLATSITGLRAKSISESHSGLP